MIRAAIAAGLDAIAFTDHDRLVPAERLAALNARYTPFRIFGGVEIGTLEEHVLVFGVHDLILEQEGWSYAALHDFVREREGFLAIAHPFRFGELNVDLERFPPDALELRSRNTPPAAEPRIRALAARHRLALLCNSDAHRAPHVGSYYNTLPDRPGDEAELLELLRAQRACPEAVIHP